MRIQQELYIHYNHALAQFTTLYPFAVVGTCYTHCTAMQRRCNSPATFVMDHTASVFISPRLSGKNLQREGTSPGFQGQLQLDIILGNIVITNRIKRKPFDDNTSDGIAIRHSNCNNGAGIAIRCSNCNKNVGIAITCRDCNLAVTFGTLACL